VDAMYQAGVNYVRICPNQKANIAPKMAAIIRKMLHGHGFFRSNTLWNTKYHRPTYSVAAMI